MKVYVTGASGFLGKLLVKKLDQLGFDTWAIVRNRTIREKEISLDFNNCSESEIYENLNDANCIIHLAAHADFNQDFSEEVYRVNCLGTIALVNVAKELNVHFILASNALIAGMHQEYIRQSSKDQPDIPYNIAKYLAEEYIIQHLRHYTILRIGGIYGYNGPEHLFLNRSITYAIHHLQILNIQNDGLGQRNYIYVEDLCSWIIHIVSNKTTGKYLVAGNEVLSMKDIFRHINNVFLEGKGQLSINLSNKSTDQIIECTPPDIIMHDYKSALNDIKNKLQNL